MKLKNEFSHKKAQKHKNDCAFLFCDFCAFLWLNLEEDFAVVEDPHQPETNQNKRDRKRE